MRYLVVPFIASVVAGEGAAVAAKQLEELASSHAKQGWKYVRLETVRTRITTPGTADTPGNPGCMGCFATPAIPGRPTTHEYTDFYMVVFSRDD